MSKITNGRLDQYGTKPFKQQQFGTAGIERVKCRVIALIDILSVTDNSTVDNYHVDVRPFRLKLLLIQTMFQQPPKTRHSFHPI